MKTLVQRTGLGFGAVFRGLRLLSAEQKIRRYAIVPFIIDLVLIFVGIIAGFSYPGFP